MAMQSPGWGPALEPYRKNVFLACKTTKRTAVEAQYELEQSLAKLKTDYFDLVSVSCSNKNWRSRNNSWTWRSFGNIYQSPWNRKDPYIGFSAHSLKQPWHYSMVSISILYCFRSIMQAGMPVTSDPQVLEKARQQGAAILALKSMARRPWPMVLKKYRNAGTNPWLHPKKH